MELSSLELNNTIVRLRKVVGQAKYRVTGKLIRRVKQLKRKKSDGVEAVQKKSEKKLERYVEDVQALKRLQPDDVSKFALLNTKTLQELKITGKTPASDRVLYKVATNDVLVSAIEEFREKYPEWYREVPFMLQRLGMQYRFRKGNKETSNIKKLLKTVKQVDNDGTNSDADEQNSDSGKPDDSLSISKPEESLLAKVKSRLKEEKLANKKRREAKLKQKSKMAADESAENGKKKRKSDSDRKSNSSGNWKRRKSDSLSKESNPISIPEGRLGQMEIMRLRIDPEFIADGGAGPSSSQSNAEGYADRDPFFMDRGALESGAKVDRKESDKVTRLKEDRRKVAKTKNVMVSRETKEHPSKCGPSGAKSAAEDTLGNASEASESTSKESLHPSWEAKRKQKLLQQSIASAPAAKKIKFD